MKSDSLEPQMLVIAGKRLVVLEEAAYEQLARKADVWEPFLPPADVEGHYPADEYAAASVARDVLRARRRLGLTQAELARRAGIRPETLNRIERAKHMPSVATIAKIDRALKKAAAAE